MSESVKPLVNVLIDWVGEMGVNLSKKRIFSYGADNLIRVVTPKEYLALDPDKRRMRSFARSNKCTSYRFGACNPVDYISSAKRGWDYAWACNSISKLADDEIDQCISQLLLASNQVIMTVSYTNERPSGWWVDKVRQYAVIENYSIKTRYKSVFLFLRPKGYRKEVLFHNMAVIGNGDTETGKGRGRLINAFNQVGRMNNYALDTSHKDDYGNKTTCWITSFNHDIVDRPLDNYTKIFCPIPIFSNSLKYRRNRNLKLRDKCINKLHTIPFDFFRDLLMHNTNPSTGLALLYWMYRENGELNDKQVFGFAFFDPNIKHHYFDDFDLCYHNGKAEQQLYEKMLNKEV
jgi:hypothetical protein